MICLHGNLLSFEKFTERKKQKAVYQEPSYLTENLKLGNRRIGNRGQITVVNVHSFEEIGNVA